MKPFAIGFVAFVFVGLGLLNWLLFGDRSSFHTGLSKLEGLPPADSDITVYQERNITGEFVTDFRIAESNLVVFAAEKQWDLQPIVGSALACQAVAFREKRPNDRKEIVDGLYYSKR